MSERVIHVVLEFDGALYEFDDPFPLGDDGPEDAANAAYYQYVEGNYSCDCNRSLFISRHCENAPDEWPDADEDGVMACGTRIKLISLAVKVDGQSTVIAIDPLGGVGSERWTAWRNGTWHPMGQLNA